MRLRDKLKTTVEDNCKKLNYILRERVVEADKTLIYPFQDFYMINCFSFELQTM